MPAAIVEWAFRALRSAAALTGLAMLVAGGGMNLGCTAQKGTPVIRIGTECAACGMRTIDLRYACARRTTDGVRMYDAIECLAREVREAAAGTTEAWLSDYDQASLHVADSMWLVRGNIPSPMGGGLAAFLDRGAAVDVAAAVNGEVVRWAVTGERKAGLP